MKNNKGLAAIYARYSTDSQSPKSLEDQIRRCRELATQYGYQVDDTLIFTDSEISGKDSKIQHRSGYQALRSAWHHQKFQAIIVDELSRLARGPREQGALHADLEEDRRVRLLTVDGIDSHNPGWHMFFAMQGALAQEELRRLRHRVPRGMQGQLERGHMIGPPAYGYALHRHYDEKGDRIATDWVIRDDQAKIVQEIYQRRADGQSLLQIAQWLNNTGVPIARTARVDGGGFWRNSRVRTLLANPIYRGVFVWHNSSCYRSNMQRQGTGQVRPIEYERPALRLVSDEIWYRCNQKAHSRSGYGGGKNPLSGLINCGRCGGILAASSPKRRRAMSLYCVSCTTAQSQGGQTDRLTSTINTEGLQNLVKKALQYCMTPAFVQAYHDALARKLGGGRREEIATSHKRLAQLRNAQDRLSRMLTAITEDDPVLEKRYHEARQKVLEAEKHLASLEAGLVRVDAAAAAAQRKIDPSTLIDQLFTADIPPEKLRAVLANIFPKIIFEGKLPPPPGHRYSRVSFLRVHLAPGAALAHASDTSQILSDELVLHIRMSYFPGIKSETRKDGRKPEPRRWEITVLKVEGMGCDTPSP